MSWENFLWACGICNLAKGEKFPAPAEGGPLINPTTETVWDFFFIDSFGNLSARWRKTTNALDARAQATIQSLRLDRQALQIARYARLKDLIEHVNDSLARYEGGQLTQVDLRTRYANWVVAPLHPDVADYFLKGPGRTQPPFSDLMKKL